MSVVVIIGYGPGNGHALARRFGSDGSVVALVGRDESRLADGVDRLRHDRVSAHAFVGDASDPSSIGPVLSAIHAQLGAIRVVALTAFQPVHVGDVLTADPSRIAEVTAIGLGGLLATVQTVRDDLVATGGSLLVVNGALGIVDEGIDGYAVSFGGDGVAIECAAKSKLVGLLAERLRPNGVYVGEIIINGSIRGSAHAGPDALDPAEVADRLWRMAHDRTAVRTHLASEPA